MVTTTEWIAIAIYFIPWPIFFVIGVRWSQDDDPFNGDLINGSCGLAFCAIWPIIALFQVVAALGRLASK